METLSNRHVASADEYLINGMNATKAYLSVYKNVKSDEVAKAASSRLLSKVNVQEYIQSRQNIVSEKKQFSFEDLVDEFQWVIQNAKEDDSVDRPSIVSSLKELGKLFAHYPTEKREIIIDKPIPITFKELPKK